jgi:hypothetical protein
MCRLLQAVKVLARLWVGSALAVWWACSLCSLTLAGYRGDPGRAIAALIVLAPGHWAFAWAYRRLA